jgi:branched-chain amino acid transport system permease protein
MPIAVWDPEVYEDSPITWVQTFEGGQIKELIEPARFDDISPIIGLGGLLLGGILLSLAITDFSHSRHGAAGAGAAATPGTWRIPWNASIIFAILVIVGVGAYLANDALTERLLDLNTNVLFFLAIVIAVLTGTLLGGLMEATLIRPLYARPIYQLMLTLGMGFIGTEMVRALWGRTGFTMPKPEIFAGSGDGCPATGLGDWLKYHCSTLRIPIGEEVARIRVYNEIFLILAGLVVLVVVWILLQRTRLGMIIRAGVQDSEMVEALGINVRRVFTLVFALGTGLAALGGVLSGPSTGLSDGMGGSLLLVALIALAIGGLTSFPGAAAGAVLVGLLQQFIIKYGQIGINLPFGDAPFKPTPTLVPAATVLLMVIILLVLPQGLFGRKE